MWIESVPDGIPMAHRLLIEQNTREENFKDNLFII